MNSAAVEFTFFEGLHDAGKLGDHHTMAELDIAEAEVDNFVDDLLAAVVPRIIPAC